MMLRRFINTAIFALISAMVFGNTYAPQIEKTKVIKKSFDVTESTIFTLKNKRGNIHFVNVAGNELTIEVSLTVKGKEEEEIQKVFNNYELLDDDNLNDLHVSGDDNIESWLRIKAFFNIKNEIKFKNGNKANNIEELSAHMVVYLPPVNTVKVENKYKSISYEQMPCTFDVEIYSGKLNGGDISGAFKLDAKYSDIKIGNMGKGEIDIYDSEFEGKNMAETEFKSKYSEIELGDIKSISLDSYDDKIIAGNITGELRCEAKYSELEAGTFGYGEFSIYDTDVETRSGDTLILESKYGSFESKRVDHINMELYTDKINITSAKTLKIKESKYSKILIEQLETNLNIKKSYDDEIAIEGLGKSMTGLAFDGKYTDLVIPIASNVGYYLVGETKYGTLSLPDDFEYLTRIKESSVLEVSGLGNEGNRKSPPVEIKAYDCNISLKSSVFN